VEKNAELQGKHFALGSPQGKQAERPQQKEGGLKIDGERKTKDCWESGSIPVEDHLIP